MYVDIENFTARRCRFESNQALENGGGVYVGAVTDVFLDQCDFLDNIAGLSGGGAYLASDGPQVTACRFDTNAASDGDGLPHVFEGRADFDGDGIPDYLDEDMDGDGVEDGKLAVSAVRYVDADNSSGTEDGRSWATAFRTIQPAIQLAWRTGGGEVWVAEGTYGECRYSAPANPWGALRLQPVVRVYGGFAATETTRDERDWTAHETIIDGFTVRGGVADADGQHSSGAGVYNDHVSPELVHCRIEGNAAMEYGGGVYNTAGASPLVDTCVFAGNAAEFSGGAVCGDAVFVRQTSGSGISSCVARYRDIDGSLRERVGARAEEQGIMGRETIYRRI